MRVLLFITAKERVRVKKQQRRTIDVVIDFGQLYDDAFLLGIPDHGYGKQLAIGCFVLTKERL